MKYKNIENLAGIMKKARKNAGMTQIQLAKKLRTGQGSISRSERGNVTSIRYAERFIRACGYELRFNHISIDNDNTSFTSFTGTF